MAADVSSPPTPPPAPPPRPNFSSYTSIGGGVGIVVQVSDWVEPRSTKIKIKYGKNLLLIGLWPANVDGRTDGRTDDDDDDEVYA